MAPADAERSQQQLRLFEALSATTPDFFYAFDLEGRFVYANRRLLEVWGRTYDEAVGRNLYELGYPRWHADMHMRELRQVIETGRPIKGEVPFTGGSGISGVYEYIFTPVVSPGGRVELITGTTRDVTDRKRAGEERERLLADLEAERAKLAAVLGATPECVKLVGPEGELLFMNPAGLCMIETAGGEEAVRGACVFDLIAPEHRARWREMHRRVCAGEKLTWEFEIVGLKGTRRWMETHAVPLPLPDGRTAQLAVTREVTTRREAEERLRASEARYRSLFDSIDQGFCVVEVLFDAGGQPVDYRFLETNPAFDQQTGLAGAVGRTARELVPTLEDRWFEVYGRVAATGEPARFEESSDPMGRWFDVYAFRTGDPAGRKVAILFKDVTESKRIEAALRASERRFRDMADTAPATLWVTEPDGYCSFLSRGWYELTGQTEGEALGLGWTDATHPDDRETAREAFLAANAARRAFAFDYRVRRADGAYRWVIDAGRPRFGPGGEFLGFIGSVIDITDRKRAEAALREGEERLRLAVTIAQMGTFEIDLLTDAVAVNEPGREIYGWAPGEPLTFTKVQTHFHPEDRAEVMRRVADAFRPDGPGEFDVEQRVVRTDGATRWIRVRGRAQFEAVAGVRRAVRCVGTYLDVTAAKEAEQEREALLAGERAARAEAERASRLKDEFLATLSHELRTPLNAILGYAQLLRHGDVSPDVAEGLEVIERNARVQTQIIEDLLEMSRVISGKMRLNIQAVDVADVVRAAAETVRPAADARGVRLQCVLDPSAGPVSGDPARLQQVMWNLLSNAIKFTPRGGRVQAVLRPVNSHVEVAVSDTGQGIAPEFLPFVFERFRQADASTTRKHGGLGIGLSIVKSIVELHGGTVRAMSPGEGCGATFVVSLPLSLARRHGEDEGAREHPKASAAAAVAPAYDRPDLRGVRVLVVDDEPDARELVRRLLQECGADVRTAATAEGALAALDGGGGGADVIVSDIGMPEVDGYEFIRRVRARGPRNHGAVPAAALTAFARSEDRTRALIAGYQTHIAKPVEPTELVAAVAALAGRTGN